MTSDALVSSTTRPSAAMTMLFNTLRLRQNGRLFADDTFKRIFLNESNRISIKISLMFVPKGLINNIPSLVLIMAWRRPGDKPLSEPMIVRSLTHIYVTRPQWDKQVLVFHEERFQQPMPSHFSKMIKNDNIFFVFPRLTSARMRLSQESFM